MKECNNYFQVQLKKLGYNPNSQKILMNSVLTLWFECLKATEQNENKFNI